VDYTTTEVELKDSVYQVRPSTQAFTFKTDRKVPKLGLMLVGLGGNNGAARLPRFAPSQSFGGWPDTLCIPQAARWSPRSSRTRRT
jgi:hypothetical protein